MIKKTGYFIVFLSILYSQISAQSFNSNIEWANNNPDKQIDSSGNKTNFSNFLFFKNAYYPDPVSMVPFYYGIFPIAFNVDNVADLNISILNQRYIRLNDWELSVLSKRKYEITNDQVFQVFRSGGVNYLTATIPVIIKGELGELKKLTSFTLNIRDKGSRKSNQIELPVAKSNSLLSSGNWVKVRVDKSGVYKITYSELVSYGLSNLQNVSVWGHGGKKLPFLNNQPSPDDLLQIPAYIEKGSDAIFNQGDYILFYAEGPLTWNYDSSKGLFVHEYHPYSKKINYFLTTDYPTPIRIATIDDGVLTPTYQSGYYDEVKVFESNDTNLVKSGREWFGDAFDVYTTRTYDTQLNDIEPASSVKVRVRACARSASQSTYRVAVNQAEVGVMQLFQVSIGDEESDFVSVGLKDYTAPAPTGNLEIKLTYDKPSPAAIGWLDYLSVNSRQKLKYQGKQLAFRDINSVGISKITKFSVQNVTSNTLVWDITKIQFPRKVASLISGSTLDFTLKTDTLRSFIAFEPDKTYQVEFVEKLENQNLHGLMNPDMVIITNPLFIDQANDLADLHRDYDGLVVEVVDVNKVYNEFSSGNRDISAIRNFMRLLYKRGLSGANQVKYLLLFGDGSYDNISDKKGNTNFIPTYQSQNSISKVQSFVTDDFYGLLDDNEGEADGLLDIGIGRLPVSSAEQAKNVVSKIKQYLSSASIGDWNQQLCFIGDDEDGNLHMDNANSLADYVANNHPAYNIQKIFFDAYLQQSTSLGERYPDVTSAINDRVNNGALIINYTGHGNEQWLSHEKVLMLGDVQSWRNFERLPLFVTATCEFSRFDDYNTTSTGEWVLLSPKGGGIGLISTTRLVYSSANFSLNFSFISTVFDENSKSGFLSVKSNDKFYRLGDIVRITKNISGGGYNKRNFMLLGDPAVMLKYPTLKMELTKVNNIPVSQPVDTLMALSKVKIEGEVKNPDGSLAASFNGQATITLFDKKKTLTTLGNNGGQTMNFSVQDNLIYKGSVTVNSGEFTLNFILPKDINYRFGNGRFSLFAQDQAESAAGYNESVIVGGINKNPTLDNQGPVINIYLNDKKFVPGGISDPNPKILLQLADSSGINTTGNSIGHDLIANISGETEKSIVLNSYYRADVDSYQKGKAEFQLTGLEKGPHKINIKAWDVFNNSSEKELNFTVTGDEKLRITHLLNYPNPFTYNTAFYFDHNQPGNDFEVLIQIFSPSGKLVKTIRYHEPLSTGYRVGPISWDGLDDYGSRIGRGVYFYQVRINTSNGKSAEQYQKLVILK